MSTLQKVKEYAFEALLDMSYEEAVSKVTDALKEEGFGVLTEIDVKATLKKKLDVDFRRYVILGACNPPYAYRTLQIDLDVGLLLPSNVIVYETDEKKVYVSVFNPMSALEVIKNDELRRVASEVSEKLKRVIHRVVEGRWLPSKEIDPTLRDLIMGLSSEEEAVRIHSRESLVRIGSPAVASLSRVLRHGSHWVRWEAAKALGEIGDPSAAPDLVAALRDEEFDVRWLASEGLTKLKTAGLQSLLHVLMTEVDSPELREGAHYVVRNLIEGGLKEYLAPVMSALDDVEPALEVPLAAKAAHEKLTEAGIFDDHL
ncbi:MAG TPA: DUF302 domain-containing protein [Thermodesulfobacteriota bacterium]|nr:DUF302 domain-containing protein [Thermodesulfobacteriota bacterium]